MSDNRYEVITWRGRAFDRYTVAALETVEDDLGRTLTIYQGSYNSGGVAASGGTHNGGGAVDCWCPGVSGPDLAIALRRRGFAAWYRPELHRNGKKIWGDHVHAVQIGNTKLSPAAAQQVIDYRQGRDGLAGHSLDSTWRPNPITPYKYREDWFQMATKAEVKAAFKEAFAEWFRDNDGGLPDIGNARIRRPDGTVTTLGHMAQEIHDIRKKG